MAAYITRVRTTEGDKQIDYNALANLPDLGQLASGATQGNLNNGIIEIARVTHNPYELKNKYTQETICSWNYRVVIHNQYTQAKLGSCIIFDDSAYSSSKPRAIIRLDHKIGAYSGNPENFSEWAITHLDGIEHTTINYFYATVVEPLYKVKGFINGQVMIPLEGEYDVNIHFTNILTLIDYTLDYINISMNGLKFDFLNHFISDYVPASGYMHKSGAGVSVNYCGIIGISTDDLHFASFKENGVHPAQSYINTSVTVRTIIPGIGEFDV